MKKLYTLLLVALSGFTVHAQNTIPNYSFENWTSGITPDNWRLFDSVDCIFFNAIRKQTGGTQGNYSLYLGAYTSSSIKLGADVEALGNLTTIPGGISVDYYTHLVQFSLSSLRIDLYFYDSLGNLIVHPGWDFTYNPATASFITEKKYFTFAAGKIPKTYALEIQFDNFNGPGGEYAVLDNLKFLALGAGVNETNAEATILAYPNPVKNVLNFDLLPGSAENIIITGIDGKSFHFSSANIFNNSLDVSFLNNGVYFLQVENKNGDVLLRQKLVKISN